MDEFVNYELCTELANQRQRIRQRIRNNENELKIMKLAKIRLKNRVTTIPTGAIKTFFI